MFTHTHTHTHTHTSTFRKIIAGISIVIILFVTIAIFIVQQKDSIVLADNQTKKIELQENEHMHIEEDASGDKVPVPNGYVGSKATGENEIDTGYVIYEGEEEVNDSNAEEAQKTRNQYVWVPVPDASKMYGIDENGKKWGKLYDFTTDTVNNVDEITGANPLNWSENENEMILINDRNNREPDTALNSFDTDSKLKTANLMKNNGQEFLIELEQEFNSMIESLEKYGGFYIGRYETGNLSKERAVTQKGNSDISAQTWYTMYKKCKGLKHNNVNVETGMIWGNQYDRTLMWLIETKNKSKEDICNNSISWGNYPESTFEYVNSSGSLVKKLEGSKIKIPTGSSEELKANNIYDLAGNVNDSTMEMTYTYIFTKDYRVIRGGGFYLKKVAKNRDATYLISDKYNDVGCRAMLYIK